MSSENSGCSQDLSVQVLSKRKNPNIHGEIFTIRHADSQQTYVAYFQPVCEATSWRLGQTTHGD